jgi:hypothetical protein
MNEMKNRYKAFFISCALSVALTVTSCCLFSVGAADGGLREQDFSSDPGWEGFENRMLPDPPHIVRQDFGWRPTNHAGGQKGGEIGGRVQRSLVPASYAMALPSTLTMEDRLEVSGRFAVTDDDGGSGFILGWFHDTSRGWRTPNSMCLRLDGNGSKYWIFYEHGTRNRYTGGGGAFEGERYQFTPTEPFPADGTSHTFKLLYDPEANGGVGEVTFQVDERIYKFDVTKNNRKNGAMFNRFGIWNQHTTGGSIEAYFDDLVVNGQPFAMDADPQWNGIGNVVTFEDPILRPNQNFGYSATNHINKTTGEIGGYMFRHEGPSYYADPVGPFTLDDPLHASGEMAMLAAGADSAFQIGWFDSASKRNKTDPEYESPQKNHLGITIEGPSRIGHYFRPFYSNAKGQGGAKGEGPVVLPDGKVHTWSLDYDPAGADGRGQITVRYDDDILTLDLKEGERESGATFDRFGFYNMQSGGWHVQAYFDNLTYSAVKTPAQ